MEIIKTKFRAGKYLMPVTMTFKDGRILMQFQYNKILIEEMKAFDGAKWDPEGRYWHIPDSQRNRFQLDYLQGKNPYARYDAPLVEVKSNRNLYSHQGQLVAFGMTRHYCVFAAEMGTGKTLAAIEIMEAVGVKSEEAWYIGPKSGVRAVDLELLKWQSKVWPKMLTYEQLTKEMKNWVSGRKAPRVVIFDESSKIKTPTAQRSQAAMALADGVRTDWGDQGYVILMSGTPAPKSPVDWFWQCLPIDSWIVTTQGLRQIKDLINVSFDAIVQGKVAHSNGFFKTSTKQLYYVITKQGYKIRCTEEERFLVDYDGIQLWKTLSELSEGDKLVISDCGNHDWNGYGDYKDGYLIGQLIGDGHVDTRDLTYGILQFYKPDFCIMPFIKEILPDASFSFNGSSYKLSSKYLNQLVRHFGFSADKFITENLLKTCSSSFLKGLISGLFDSDGTVEQTRLRISLASNNYVNAYRLQLILNSLGVTSTIIKYKGHPHLYKGRRINTNPIQYRLMITNQDAIKFHNKIGFNHPEKRAKLIKRIQHKHTWINQNIVEIISIEKDIVEDVYDCEVEDIHMFTANGLVVHNCETAQPGFFREGNIHKFRNRLAIIEERENRLTGGKYPHLIGWRDSEDRCECGHMKHDDCHNLTKMGEIEVHPFKPGKNEVAHLYERMKGLVLVLFKKDCLDLPEKQYRVVIINPAPDLLLLARHIKKVQSRAITVLTLLRELSDGFQYTEIPTGEFMVCPRCHGSGKVMIPVPHEPIDTTAPTKEVNEAQFGMQEMNCDNCGGSGQAETYTRSQDEVPCPKDEQLKEDLDAHEDIGRLIVWGGFTGTIDRIVKICQGEGWSVLRVDGRGYCALDDKGQPLDDRECLMAMDGSHPRRAELLEKYPKLCFVGHPKAGGMALTLTATPTEIFFSNDFSGEGRMQAEDRAHRPGMDTNKGLTIVDYIHLPSDQYVLDNLKKKKDLQKISMGELDEIFKSVTEKEKDAAGENVPSSRS